MHGRCSLACGRQLLGYRQESLVATGLALGMVRFLFVPRLVASCIGAAMIQPYGVRGSGHREAERHEHRTDVVPVVHEAPTIESGANHTKPTNERCTQRSAVSYPNR